MSLFSEIKNIREQIHSDYKDYMQAFAIQRGTLNGLSEVVGSLGRAVESLSEAVIRLKEAVVNLEDGQERQEKAIARYQQKTDLIFDKIEQQFVEFDARITRLERKVS